MPDTAFAFDLTNPDLILRQKLQSLYTSTGKQAAFRAGLQVASGDLLLVSSDSVVLSPTASAAAPVAAQYSQQSTGAVLLEDKLACVDQLAGVESVEHLIFDQTGPPGVAARPRSLILRTTGCDRL